MIINCNGLKGTSRFTEFQTLLNLHNPDIVLGTESKLHNDILTYSVFPSNYTLSIEKTEMQMVVVFFTLLNLIYEL